MTGSNRKNPFYEEPLHKAFYHPSRKRVLSKEIANTALSSERVKDELEKIKNQSEVFVKASNTYTRRMVSSKDANQPTHDTSDRFDESWPDTERPSTISIPDIDQYQSPRSEHQDPLEELQQYKTRLITEYRAPKTEEEDDHKDVAGKDSTLSKYIERFRHGTPMSREERQRKHATKQEDFWWLHHKDGRKTVTVPRSTEQPSHKSNNNNNDKKEASRRHREPSGTTFPDSPSDSSTPREVLSKTNLKKMTSALAVGQNPWAGDEETIALQARADRLLEKSSSSLNTSDPVVSTVGLGSTSASNVSTVTETEEPYRPAFTRPAPRGLPPRGSGGPHDDILQQWRLRRKMDTARQRLGAPHNSVARDGVDQGKLPTPEVDTELETRLAKFRERLKMGSGSFTPAPVRQIEQTSQAPVPGTKGASTTTSREPPVASSPSQPTLSHGHHQPAAQTTPCQHCAASSKPDVCHCATATENVCSHATKSACCCSTNVVKPTPKNLCACCHGNQLVRSSADAAVMTEPCRCDAQYHQPGVDVAVQIAAAETESARHEDRLGTRPETSAVPPVNPKPSTISPPRSSKPPLRSSVFDSRATVRSSGGDFFDMQSSLDTSERLLSQVAPLCHDSDASFEQMKLKHLKALRREGGIGKDEISKMGRGGREMAMVQEIPVRDSDSRAGTVVGGQSQGTRDKGRDGEVVGSRQDTEFNDGDGERESVGQKEKKDGGGAGKDRNMKDAVVHPAEREASVADQAVDHEETDEKEEPERKVRGREDDEHDLSGGSADEVGRRRTGRKKQAAKSEKMERKKDMKMSLHSSPKHSVQSTIGQVIGERLFLPGMSSVLSSIDSHNASASLSINPKHAIADSRLLHDTDNSLHQPSAQHQVVRDRECARGVAASSLDFTGHEDEDVGGGGDASRLEDDRGSPVDLDHVIESEGEEFPEDDILQDLRRRRKLYLSRLHAIDAVMAERS